MRQQTKNPLRKIRNSEVINLETNPNSAVMQRAQVDPERPATRKFGHTLITANPRPNATVFGIRTRNEEWRSISTEATIPTFMDLTNETRSRILHVIFTYGAAPSSTIAYIVGLTARQIGQIRRWHIQRWRKINNQHVKSANNLGRVVI